MRITLAFLATLALLTACATPQTVLRNKNGDVAICGGSSTGSILGGAVGYAIQRSNDDECVRGYVQQGYRIAEISGVSTNGK